MNRDACEIILIDQKKVQKVESALPESGAFFRLAEVFKALGDPTRVKLLYALTQAELCVCDLAALLGVSASAVSHQLRTLRNLRLVKYRRKGKIVYYSLDDDHVNQFLHCGMEHIQEGAPPLRAAAKRAR